MKWDTSDESVGTWHADLNPFDHLVHVRKLAGTVLMPAVFLTAEKYFCQHLLCNTKRSSAGPSFTMKVSLFWELIRYFIGDVSLLSMCILGMGSLSITRLPLGTGCVVFLFKEHFLYRSDTRLHSPVSVGILKHREVRGQVVLRALVPNLRRSRQYQMSGSSENWQQGVSEKHLLWFSPSPLPVISFNDMSVLVTALFGNWSHRCMG